MKAQIKSFYDFVNENYHSELLEANSDSVIKEFANSKFTEIKEAQDFLKKYGARVVDGKGGSKKLKITEKVDQDTICAFWAFLYGIESMIPEGSKYPERKTEEQLLERAGINKSGEKNSVWNKIRNVLGSNRRMADWLIKKKIYEFVQKRNGVNPIPPYPVPDSLIGTKSYYVYRNDDFKRRSKNTKTPPDYYLSYGDKYCKAFSEKTRPKLSQQGKIWLDKTLVALQEAIEKKLKVDPKIELDSTKFRKYAFDSHPSAYIKSGLFSLSPADLYEVAMTPEWRDLLTEESMMQVLQIIKEWSAQKAEQIAALGFRVWNSAKGAYEVAKTTVAKALGDWYNSAKTTGEKVAKNVTDFIDWLWECEQNEKLKGYPSLNS